MDNTVNKVVKRFPHGVVNVPPSKSILHRVVICNALAGGKMPLKPVSDDIDATVRCMRSLMAVASGERVIAKTDDEVADALHRYALRLDCGESGSTLRFLLPLALAMMSRLGEDAPSVTFTGHGRLLERPMTMFLDELTRHGAMVWQKPNGITVAGTLQAGRYELAGNVSSQFVTGLLLALPLLDGDSEIHLTTPLESAGYVDLTIEELAKSGVEIERDGDDFRIRGSQSYTARELDAERDFSQAAFFLVAAALGRDVRCAGLRLDSQQGDMRILELLQEAGFEIEVSSALRVLPRKGQVVRRKLQVLPLEEVDVSDIPDLVPPLAALLCVADGTSRLTNAGRLRMKESDRLEAVKTELNAIGADIEIDGDTLVIYGVSSLVGGTVNSRGDHRIAMMAAVAAIRADAPVTIVGAECVKKSYPDFWRDFEVRAL